MPAVPKPVKEVKKRKKSKKTPESKLIDEIDDIDSDICLIEAGFVCMKCWGRATMNHHFFHKSSHGAVRFDKRNHCPVCFGCHQYRIHGAGETEEIRDAIIYKIGQDEFDDLKKIAWQEYADRSMPFLRSLLRWKKQQLLIVVDRTDPDTLCMMTGAAKKRLEKARKSLI
jgi:hypothetical protein